jgi:hypothetical protein
MQRFPELNNNQFWHKNAAKTIRHREPPGGVTQRFDGTTICRRNAQWPFFDVPAVIASYPMRARTRRAG